MSLITRVVHVVNRSNVIQRNAARAFCTQNVFDRNQFARRKYEPKVMMYGAQYKALHRHYSNQPEEAEDVKSKHHNIIRSTEKPVGSSDKHEFQAETRMLLDIVARSLYSENEVFVRELISNASDALEKFRYTIHTAGEHEKDYEAADRPLEIHIATDKQNMQLTIQDTGIGMTREELIQNLGTIARRALRNS